MKIQEKIAIIIVTYNGEKWLNECIKPLYSIENIKIIVVDNASSDNTVKEISNLYPEVELIISNKNLGFGQANNLGFEFAIKNNFDYVFLLNQDASIDINNLSMLVDSYKNDSSIGILSPIHFMNEDEVENVFKFYLSDNKLTLSDVGGVGVKEVNFVNAALWLISVDKLSLMGGFNPLFFHYGEDVDYVNSTISKKNKICIDLNVKGFHYRNYNKEEFKNNFDKSRYFGPWNVKYYTVLSNVKSSFLKCIFRSLKLFIKSFLKYFMKGYFSSAFMSLKVYLNVISEINMIRKNRKIIQNENFPFLNL
ncbi:glycosyltransferase [Empedobacter brevis]